MIVISTLTLKQTDDCLNKIKAEKIMALEKEISSLEPKDFLLKTKDFKKKLKEKNINKIKRYNKE